MRFTAAFINLAVAVVAVTNIGGAIAAPAPEALEDRQLLGCLQSLLGCTAASGCTGCPTIPPLINSWTCTVGVLS